LSHSFRHENGDTPKTPPSRPPQPFAQFALLPTRAAARVRILFGRVEQPIFRVCWQRIEAPLLEPSLSPISNTFMKTNKVPRERNPFLLSRKRRWRQFHWIWGRTRRDGAANNLLSHNAKPV
jgi:hypothetical protein